MFEVKEEVRFYMERLRSYHLLCTDYAVGSVISCRLRPLCSAPLLAGPCYW